jgi:hypothetical protein
MLPTLIRKPDPDDARRARLGAEAAASRSANPSHGATVKAAARIAERAASGKDLMIDPAAAGDVFHTVELDSADRRPDYIYYDAISYPRVSRDVPNMNPRSELENMWMVGFLHHEEKTGPEGANAAQVKEYERRFGVRKGADAEKKDHQKRLKAISKAETSDQVFTKEERKRLRDLERQFAEEARDKARGPLSESEKLQKKLSKSAYATENRKIRKVLQLRTKGGKRQLELFGTTAKRKVLQSAALENLAYLGRLEQQAAVLIQRAFRKYHRLVFWKKWLRATQAAITIQKCARGYIIRKLIREWIKQRESLVTKAQSIIRGRIARDVVRREKSYLAASAMDIQRCFRGFLFRYHARADKREQAARKIQALWRGVRSRADSDRMYLDTHVVTIQRAARGWIQRLRFRKSFRDLSYAATRVQALFRSFQARSERNELLWDRETRSREMWMSMLRSEQRWVDSEIERRVKARAREAVDEQLKVAELEWRKACDKVALYEFDLVSLENERVKLSPRAIQQGWAVQLRQDVEQHRDWVTESKAKALFEAGARHRALSQRRSREDEVAQELLSERRDLENRWVDERNALWRRLNERRWASEQLELAKRAADEKRRWRIVHYTETGKPDLDLTKRLDRLAQGEEPKAETRVYTMATQSILALLPDGGQDVDSRMAIADQARTRRMITDHAMAVQVGNSGDAGRLQAMRNVPLLEDIPTRPAMDVAAPRTVDERGNFVGFDQSRGGHATVVGSHLVQLDGPGGGSSYASMAGGRGLPTAGTQMVTIDEEAAESAATMHAHAVARVQSEGEMTEEDDEDMAPESQFYLDILRARRGQGRMPAFMRSGLVSTEGGDDADAGRKPLLDDDATLQALAALPPGMLAARRANAAAAIARARVNGTVGETDVQDKRAERRKAIEEEIAEFNRQGARVQKLADKLGAVSGVMELAQYSTLLKPLFDTMNKLSERLGAAPAQAERTHGVVKEEEDGPKTARRKAREAAAAAAAGTKRRERPKDSLLEPVEFQDLPDSYKERLGGQLSSAQAAIDGRSRLPPLQKKGAVGFDISNVNAHGVVEPSLLPSASPGQRRRGGVEEEDDMFLAAGRRARARKKRYETMIPWSLLDELEAEKDKLIAEQKRVLDYTKSKGIDFEMPSIG